MSEPHAKETDTGVIHAALNYLVRTDVKPVNETGGKDGLMRNWSGTIDRRVMPIADARNATEDFKLDGAGFELAAHPTRVKNFLDADELTAVYYPEMQRLIAQTSGASRVHVFDHTVRHGDDEARQTLKLREPVKSVHNDYTEWSGPQRVRDFFPEQADDLLSRRFAIIQVWRPINHPVVKDPFAIADGRSVATKDFIAAERRFPDRVGEIYQFEYNPAHRWYFYPQMRRDEAMVFKVYDSAKDGRCRWTMHSSFDDPATPADASPRESIEIRAFAFFDA
jgi:hypothetical protein